MLLGNHFKNLYLWGVESDASCLLANFNTASGVFSIERPYGQPMISNLNDLNYLFMETEEKRRSVIPQGALIAMAIFMILVYIGMGILFFIDLFGWGKMAEPWPVLNYVCGVILILYGIYRGYRLYKGIGTPV